MSETHSDESRALPHVTVYRPGKGPFSPAVRYCLGCRWVTSGAEDAMKRSAERHEAASSGRQVPSDG